MKLKARELTVEAFAPYGSFVLASECLKDTGEPIAYVPEQLNVALCGSDAAIGVCRVAPQQKVMGSMESHAHTEEGWILINGAGVAAFGRPGADADAAQYEAFLIPQGTILSLKTGVWHFGPFPVNGEALYAYAILPPGTPENDLIMSELKESIEIE